MDDLFEAIAHEVRRKIIISLAKGPKSFSELQKETGLDSPALAFHIKKLNGLITKNQQGNYELTQLGWSAYNVITQLMQQPQVTPKQSKKSFHDYINGMVNTAVSNIAEGVFSLLNSISSKLWDDDLIITYNTIPLIEVFNGTLPLKKSMVITADGVKVKIMQGDNRAVIKCLDFTDFNLEENETELHLSLDGCVATIYYPQLERLKLDIDGGAVNVQESVNELEVKIDGGYAGLKVNGVRETLIDIDGGVVAGELNYPSDGRLEIYADGGVVKLTLVTPEDVGLIVDKYVNGGSVQADNVIRARNIIGKVQVDGGVIRVDKK